MIILLFVFIITVLVTSIKEMAKSPEKTLPENVQKGLVDFYTDIKTVISNSKNKGDKSHVESDELDKKD